MRTFRCRCEGGYHRIGWTRRGQLVALDHSRRFSRERALAELGGRLPACYHVVYGPWTPARLPGAIAKPAVCRRRERAENLIFPPPETVMSFRDRYQALAQLAVAAVFPSQCYRHRTLKSDVRLCPTYRLPPAGGWSLEVNLYRRELHTPAGLVAWEDSPWNAPTHRVKLPTCWWRDVHRRGIDVLGGRLILGATWGDDAVALDVLCQSPGRMLFHSFPVTLPLSVVCGARAGEIHHHPPWAE